VAAVGDDVVVTSTTGAVRFSRALTLEAVRAIPSLAAELEARGGRVPLLRLPFDVAGTPREGFVTEVRVTVRPDADLRSLLDALDPTLLLVLPGLTSMNVQGRLLTAVREGDDVLLDGQRWRVHSGSGHLEPELLAGRPVEEQAQTAWSVTWAVPVAAGRPVALPSAVPPVVRAPTATDDPLSAPAVLAASLPLGPDRRRVLPGPLTDAVLGHAGRLLVELVETLPLEPSRLSFVPGPLGDGEIDAAVGSAVLQAFRDSEVLGVPAADAVVLEGSNPQLVELLTDLLPGLLPHPWATSQWARPLRALGARRLSLAELTELLAGVSRPADWWGRLYAALPPDVDQLGALPVPLVGGGLAPSPRGLLMADAAMDLSPLGFRVVDPAAAHALLLRLGAQHAEPRTLLQDPRVRRAVEAFDDEEHWDEGSEQLVQSVLALVGAADLRPGEIPWLAGLPLPTAEGDLRPAGELLLPGGSLASVVDLDAGFGVVADGVAHPDVLAAVGVLRTFAAVPVEQAEDVDGLDAWLASLDQGEEPGLVVRDLDLVLADAWPRALVLLEAGELLTPYTLWWLTRHPVLDGQRPDTLRIKGSDLVLEGLLDVTDHPLARRLGAVEALSEVRPEVLLERLADPSRTLTRLQVRAVHAQLARLADLPLPARVRTAGGVVPAEDAVVVDRPDLLARVAPYAVVPVPLDLARGLAEALDLALASELLDQPGLAGTSTPWGEAEGSFVEHDRLEAASVGGDMVQVGWIADGLVDHVVGADGKARALAWRLGDWSLRHALLARFRGESDEAEADLDPLP
jgi:hypothetical protein